MPSRARKVQPTNSMLRQVPVTLHPRSICWNLEVLPPGGVPGGGVEWIHNGMRVGVGVV